MNIETYPRWFALRVRSRCEKLAAEDLARRGFEVFSACAPQRRVWLDRVRTVEMPMFAGYIFARFVQEQGPEVLRASGVVSIVGFGTSYHPVEDSEIEALQIVVHSGVDVFRDPLMNPGALVRVCHGLLRGLEGKLVQIKNQHRLLVSVQLLNRWVAVEIDDALVQPLSRVQSRAA